MQPGLEVGAEAEVIWQVAAEHVIHLGYPPPSLVPKAPVVPASHRTAVVFSTPNMILLMERAARKVIEPFLEPGEASVGATVNVEHLAGTPLGSEVRAVARVTEVAGRSIHFDIAAYDRYEQIGRGTHRRAVVPLEKIALRMQQKAGVDSVTIGFKNNAEIDEAIQRINRALTAG
ncbi:MAG: thioesterase family protein [Planctomycetaceae bacterium]